MSTAQDQTLGNFGIQQSVHHLIVGACFGVLGANSLCSLKGYIGHLAERTEEKKQRMDVNATTATTLALVSNMTMNSSAISTDNISDLSTTTAGQGHSVISDFITKATYDLIHEILRCYVNPVISMLGIVGNILSFMVLIVQKRRSMNSVLLPLAVVDTLYLLLANVDFVQCVVRQFDALAGRNVKVLTLPNILWIGVTLSRVSSALTIVIAVERCLVVLLPLRFKTWVSQKAIYVTTAFACVIPFIAHVPVFLRGEITWRRHARLNVSLPYLTLTDFAKDNAYFLNVYKNLVLNVLFRLVPMATVSFCSGLTIHRLRQYSAWRASSTRTDTAFISDKDARATTTLVRVCVVFIVCSLPGTAMLIWRLFEPEFDYYGLYAYTFKTAVDVNELFLCINSSVNFIIYIRFGDDFYDTFRRICRRTFPACCTACLSDRKQQSRFASNTFRINGSSSVTQSFKGREAGNDKVTTTQVSSSVYNTATSSISEDREREGYHGDLTTKSEANGAGIPGHM